MTFTAAYDGRCPDCGETIEAGDALEWSEFGQAVHQRCDLAENAPAGPTCPTCWTEIPLSGVCGVCE